MAVSITSQPAFNALVAAYRPIVISVSIVPAGPVMYCDVYFNNVFYKTISKTQGFDFDIQDAAKEYLKKYLPPNGSGAFYLAAPVIVAAFVKIRNSTVDSSGFTIPGAPIPVQATSTTTATAGGGVPSNTFYIINAVLQHEDNQNLAAHLSSFKNGTWNGSTYPLTHRVDKYIVGKLTSDFFPIVTGTTPNCVRINYKLKSTGTYTSATSCPGAVDPPPPPPPPNPDCISVGTTGVNMPDGKVGDAYSYTLGITGDQPYTITNKVKPTWMDISLNSAGDAVVLTGTPIAEGTSITISFTVNNACGAVPVSDTINIAPADVVTGAGFGTTTFVSGDTLNDVEIANLTGQPNSTATITLTTLDNTNGGQLKVNNAQVFQGNTFTVNFDGSGNGSLNVAIAGISGHPNSVIRGIFTITAVSAGTIDTNNNTYQISKLFTS